MLAYLPLRLLRTSAMLLLIQVGGMTAAFALSIVLARALGAPGFGVYSYALAIATLLAVPVQLGMPTLVVRETAKLKQAGELRQMYRVWSWASLAVLVVSAALVLPIWFVLPFAYSEALTPQMLLIVMALVPFMAIGELRAAALRGLGHVIKGQLSEMLLRPTFMLLLTLVVLALGNSELEARSALFLNLAATGFAFLVGVVLLARAAPARDRGAMPQSRHRDWMRAGIFLGIASSAMVVNRNLDIAMLGSLRPSAEVGVYKVAITLAMLSATVLSMLNLAVQPRIANLHVAGDMAGMRRLVTLVTRMGFSAGCLVALIFFFLGQNMIELAFGEEFKAAYEAMIIIIAGQLANTFFGPVAMILNMCGEERVVMYGVLLAAAGNVMLNALLIPPFGILGAASATTLTLLAWNVILALAAHRRLGIDTSIMGFHSKESK